MKLRIAGIPLLLFGLVLLGCQRSDQQSSDAETVDVVAILPLTGAAGSVGEQLRAGIEVAREKLSGLELTYEDSQSNPSVAVTAANRMLSSGEDTQGFITALSSVSSAVLPVTAGRGHPTVLTTVATPGMAEEYENAQQLFWLTDEFIPPIASVMAENHDRNVFLYVDDEYGQASLLSANKAIPSEELVLTEGFPVRGGDVAALASKVADLKPEGIFVVGFGPDYIELMKKLRALVPNATLYTSMNIHDPSATSQELLGYEGLHTTSLDQIDETTPICSLAHGARTQRPQAGPPRLRRLHLAAYPNPAQQ